MHTALAKDPDLLEAYAQAYACTDEHDKDSAIDALILVSIETEVDLARSLVKDLSTRLGRASIWREICFKTNDKNDVLAFERAVQALTDDDEDELKDEVLREALNGQGHKSRLLESLKIAQALSEGDLVKARAECDRTDLDHLYYLVKIAECSRNLIDVRRLRDARKEIITQIEMTQDPEFADSRSGALYYIKTALEQNKIRTKRERSLATFNRMKALKDPSPKMLAYAACTLARNGGVEEAKTFLEKHPGVIDQNDIDEAFSMGYSLLGNLSDARKHAQLTTHPRSRSIAYTNLFAAKQRAQ